MDKDTREEVYDLDPDNFGRVLAEAMEKSKTSHIMMYEDQRQRRKFDRVFELVKKLFEDDDDAVISVVEDREYFGACTIRVTTYDVVWDKRTGEIGTLYEILEIANGFGFSAEDGGKLTVSFSIPGIFKFKNRKSEGSNDE